MKAKLSTRPARTGAIQKQKEEMAQRGKRETRLVADIPSRFHRRLKGMSAGAMDPNSENQNVAIKDLVVEALEGLFEKYEKGDGYYILEKDEDE
ncbi:hypothetical protein V6238_18395 [Marinomonas arenicola]|jgi:hypothetical protein|uniref:hypothetical protein n=1 Tax=Marinomonas arenicola TaxID=569601 RepID=UPI00311D788F